MNVIIPPKRRDKKTSFKKLVSYVSTREKKKPGEAVTHEAVHSTGTEYVATPGFGQLVDYVGRKRATPVTEIVSISPGAFSACSPVKCCVKPTASHWIPPRQK